MPEAPSHIQFTGQEESQDFVSQLLTENDYLRGELDGTRSKLHKAEAQIFKMKQWVKELTGIHKDI